MFDIGKREKEFLERGKKRKQEHLNSACPNHRRQRRPSLSEYPQKGINEGKEMTKRKLLRRSEK